MNNLNRLLTIQAVGKYKNKNNSMAFSLLIDIIGSYITFYLTQLKSDGLYLMVELDHLRLSLNELSQLIGYVDRLYNILNVFEEYRVLPAVKEIPSNKYRETMKSTVIKTLTEKTIDRSRTNHFQRHYNESFFYFFYFF